MKKSEIKAALSFLYKTLNHSDELRASINLSDGSLIHAGKQFQRFGRVAWKPLYGVTRFDGQNSGLVFDSIPTAVSGIFQYLGGKQS